MKTSPFARDETIVLDAYFSDKSPYSLYEAMDRLGVPEPTNPYDRLDAAVGQILVQSFQKRLPNCGIPVDDHYVLTRTVRERKRPRALSLIPRHLMTIHWAGSSPAMSCPEAYHAVFVPGYERFVVIASEDGPELYGSTDQALGWFRKDDSLLESVGNILRGHWWAECAEWEAPPWDCVVEEGLVNRELAETWRTMAWAPEDEEEDSGVQDLELDALGCIDVERPKDHPNATQGEHRVKVIDPYRQIRDSDLDDAEQLLLLGDDPETWGSLSDEDLEHLVMLGCIDYGLTGDAARIENLFRLYRYASTRLEPPERMQLLQRFAALVEEHDGEGALGLLMFLMADNEPDILTSTTLNMAVLLGADETEVLAGPTFVVDRILEQRADASRIGASLGGVLLLGDKRLLPLLENAWSRIDDRARIELVRARSGFVTEAVIEFWLRCLEKGCSDAVFGAVVAGLARMPTTTLMPFVVDVERVLPAYRDKAHPIRRIRQTSFSDYLEEIRPRLAALEAVESEPKVIPLISAVWEDPGSFRATEG